MRVYASEEDRAAGLERLRLWTGLDVDAELLEQVVSSREELLEQVREGWADIREIRDALAQLWIGADWPEPEALAPIAAAAAERGVAFVPVREGLVFDPGELAAAADEILQRQDLVLSADALESLFRDDPDLYAEYVDCGRSLLDTMLRETILDTICRRFVGRSWPLYGDTDETKQAFFEALEAAVVPGTFELNPAPDAVVRRAAERRERGDLAGALAAVEEVLAEDATHQGARLERARVEQALGQHEPALHTLDALTAELPEAVGLSRLRGFSLAALGRSAEASAALRRYVDHMEPPPDAEGRVLHRRGPPGALAAAKALLAELEG